MARRLRVVVAPDSFGGALDSVAVRFSITPVASAGTDGEPAAVLRDAVVIDECHNLMNRASLNNKLASATGRFAPRAASATAASCARPGAPLIPVA